jgi:elongation factor Ts
LEALGAAAYPGGGTVSEALTQMIAKIGENMSLRRAGALQVSQGVVAAYVHNQAAPGLGKIGVLVALESAGDADKLTAFGRQLAMHVAAAAPQAVSTEDLDATALERERNVLAEQARASGKPEEIVEKMVEGRLRKYYAEVCLLDQTFVIDNESNVRQAVEAAGEDAGAPIAVTGFQRFKLGEGVEREESDFAAEVAAQLGG